MDRSVTYFTSGMTGRHIATDIAIASALIWVGYQLWGTNVR